MACNDICPVGIRPAHLALEMRDTTGTDPTRPMEENSVRWVHLTHGIDWKQPHGPCEYMKGSAPLVSGCLGAELRTSQQTA